MKELTYKIVIKASPDHVWNTMLGADTYREWTNVAWPGSLYKGQWKEGEKISFVSKDGAGTLALLTVYEPFEKVVVKHIAVLLPGGVEDTISEMAKGWIGTIEEYNFRSMAGDTELTVTMTTSPEWQQMFDEGWGKALDKLKEVCER